MKVPRTGRFYELIISSVPKSSYRLGFHIGRRQASVLLTKPTERPFTSDQGLFAGVQVKGVRTAVSGTENKG